MNEECLICGHKADLVSSNDLTGVWYCELCGNYILADYITGTLNGSYNVGKYDLLKLKSALFYYLRVVKKNHLNTDSTPITISINKYDSDLYIDLDTVYNLYPDNFNDRLDMVIELLASKINDVGQWFYTPTENFKNGINKMQFDIFFMPSNVTSAYYQRGEFIRLLKELQYITSDEDGKFSFTAKGWEKVYFLRKKNNSKTAFIAMSFSFDNPVINSAKSCIETAISSAGYIPSIISDKQHNNFIMDEILYEIQHSAFVVADLTEQKTGVYYEAGFAKALGKEVIFTCHETDFNNRHFDIAQVNTIKWENPDEFVKDLIRRIEITVGLNKKNK
ncbi:hypothetical protein [Anaerosinus massiliensis]|uniref:hypothetical protein n=1 Tax=Massilibacillus massiliensis TaxID=1806837 RepID=UPI000A865D8E|nr:hypothetical protein [Massilibacillus massiliensis]